MKVDNAFDKTELLQHLRTAYDRPLRSITFFPEGEDSYGYIVVSEAGGKYFAKASTGVLNSRLEAAYHLRYRCNVKSVVAPLETSDGTLSIPWHDFRVSLFPFIEGFGNKAAGICGKSEKISRMLNSVRQLLC